jgi:hypothetical protein
LLVRDPHDLERRVNPFEHCVENAAHEIEPFGIFPYDPTAALGRTIIQIADRSRSGINAAISFRFQTSFDVDTLVIVFKFCLRAKKIQQKFIVRRVAENLSGRNDLAEFAEIEKIN